MIIWLSFIGIGKVASQSIQDAISHAGPGDTVWIEPGFYQEGNIVIDKKLILIGKDFPVVDGKDSNEVFTITADSVTISGFRVQNCGVSYINDLAGIRIDQHKGCLIENNQLYNTFFGIYLKNAGQCTIRNNYIEGKARDEFSSGNAIHVWYSKDIRIEGNTCIKHRDGIYLEFVERSTIERNQSRENLRYGLHFMFSNHDNYVANNFRDNGAGVAVMFSHNISMTGNTFEHNWGSNAYGLLLKDITDSDIRHNEFLENTIGIYADGANRVNVEGNQFYANGWALKMLGSCYGSVITGNNFISNTFDVFTNSSVNNNSYLANYWSSYTGYDLDRDNVGDVPYNPVKLFSYVTGIVPTSIILLRSPFIDMLNFAEKVVPALTPSGLQDGSPLMKEISWR